jgi:hypothetical protein
VRTLKTERHPRPGGLTDDVGTGNVRIDEKPFRGSVARDDVAELVAQLLPDSRSIRRILYISSGEESIARALDAVLGT